MFIKYQHWTLSSNGTDHQENILKLQHLFAFRNLSPLICPTKAITLLEGNGGWVLLSERDIHFTIVICAYNKQNWRSQYRSATQKGFRTS